MRFAKGSDQYRITVPKKELYRCVAKPGYTRVGVKKFWVYSKPESAKIKQIKQLYQHRGQQNSQAH